MEIEGGPGPRSRFRLARATITPHDGDSRRPRPPEAIIAERDSNRIGIHSMA
jgi:hypothetical protein